MNILSTYENFVVKNFVTKNCVRVVLELCKVYNANYLLCEDLCIAMFNVLFYKLRMISTRLAA